MKDNIWYKIGQSISATLFELLYKGEAFGTENIPKTGPFLLASNHESFFDPFLGGCFIKRHIHFFARKSLFKGNIINWMLKNWNAIPVNRGSGDVQAMKKVLALLKQGEAVMVFPQGTRGGNEARRGIGMMALKTKVPVVPMRIIGASEAYGRGRTIPKLTGKISVVYGKPLYPEHYDFTEGDKYEAASNHIMQEIKNLKPL